MGVGNAGAKIRRRGGPKRGPSPTHNARSRTRSATLSLPVTLRRLSIWCASKPHTESNASQGPCEHVCRQATCHVFLAPSASRAKLHAFGSDVFLRSAVLRRWRTRRLDPLCGFLHIVAPRARLSSRHSSTPQPVTHTSAVRRHLRGAPKAIPVPCSAELCPINQRSCRDARWIRNRLSRSHRALRHLAQVGSWHFRPTPNNRRTWCAWHRGCPSGHLALHLRLRYAHMRSGAHSSGAPRSRRRVNVPNLRK